jgi:tetratricopeptide (TPR) repeat protein
MRLSRPRRCIFRHSLFRRLFGLLFVPFWLSLAAAWPQAAPQTIALVPHTPALVTVETGNTATFTLNSTSASQTEVFLDSSAPGAEFAIVGAGGKTLGTLDARRPGWQVASFQSAGQGICSIKVISAPADMAGVSIRAFFLTHPSNRGKRIATADALFQAGQELAASPLAAPELEAIQKFRQANNVWAQAGDREAEILALAGEAQARLNLSQNAASLAALETARGLSTQEMPLWNAWLESREAEVYLDRMNSTRAATHARLVLQTSHDLNDPWLTAGALADLAEAEYFMRASSARDSVTEALRLSRQVHALLPLARALRCSAWIEQDAGGITHALSLLQDAEDLFERAGDRRDAAIGMSDMANNQALSGDAYSALVRQSALVPLLRTSGKRTYLQYLFTGIAQDYARLNRFADAVVYSKMALRLSQQTQLPLDEMGSGIELNQLCEFQQKTGDLRQAMDDCSRAYGIFKEARDPKLMAIASWQLGKAQRALHRPDEAVASFRLSSEMAERARAAFPQPQALMDWGDTVDNQGDAAQARKLFEKAASLSIASEDTSALIEARYRIARSEFRSGQTPEAERDLLALVATIEKQRRAVTDPDLQASYFAQLHKCHELLIELLMRQNDRNPASGDADRALEVSESGRARTLFDDLAMRTAAAHMPSGGASPQLVDLHRAVDRYYDQRLRLMLARSRGSAMEVNAAGLTQAIDALERREDEQSANPAPRPEPTFRTADFAAASEKLHSTLIEYSLGTERSFVWVIDGGTVRSYELPARRPIENAIVRWRARVTERGKAADMKNSGRERIEAADRELPGVAAKLSCMLLAPFLRPNMTHLVIVPDGPLNLLPFAALPENGCHGGDRPIALEHEVVRVPSFSILLSSIQSPDPRTIRDRVAILADPVFDRGDPRVHAGEGTAMSEPPAALTPALPRLFGSRDEAKAIAAAAGAGRSVEYLGFSANATTLFDPSLRNYGILHLATHGIFDEARPEFSGIVLSLVNRDGQPVFGYLNAHSIAESDLPFDLVVLSSCDSAAGPTLTGEGVLGLNHAFLSAGARRIVSTLWSVDDDATTEFMADFYNGLLRRGLDPAEALRQSQLKMMRNPHTASPFYWAGFTITSTVN